jgi:hypothetical protein
VILKYKIAPLPFLVESAFNITDCSFSSMPDLRLLAATHFAVPEKPNESQSSESS